jgi:hypothetical protein
MSKLISKHPPEQLVEMREAVITPEELAAAEQRRHCFLRNMRTFEALDRELLKAHVGEYVAVANGEAFFASDMFEAIRLAETAHPEHKGASFIKYIRARIQG